MVDHTCNHLFTLRRPRQGDQEFEVSLGYITKHCLKKRKEKDRAKERNREREKRERRERERERADTDSLENEGSAVQ
jgi:hypothetical protein